MEILLIGYGKMGKAIEEIAIQKDHRIAKRITLKNQIGLESLDLTHIDLAIEFTTPDSAFSNIAYCLDHNIPVVSGTTGWLERKKEIDQLCKVKQGSFFYASNFSIGVNVLYKVNEYLAKLMNKYGNFKVDVDETHHQFKVDKPSGTALQIISGILANNKQITNWKLESSAPLKRDIGSISVSSNREGNVTGEHTVKYNSDLEQISLGHIAFDRKCFASGVIEAAEFTLHRKGVLGMDDLLFEQD